MQISDQIIKRLLRVLGLIALLICFPLTARADAGTPLVWAGNRVFAALMKKQNSELEKRTFALLKKLTHCAKHFWRFTLLWRLARSITIL